MNENQFGLYDHSKYHDNCGVGFITRKDGQQSHDVLLKGHEALCEIPHRGGMSAEGVGDGAGINIDISLNFFRKILGKADLQAGEYGVANFFYPLDHSQHAAIEAIIKEKMAAAGMPILQWRDVPTNPAALTKPNGDINEASVKAQQVVHQMIFARPESCATQAEFEVIINDVLLAIETIGYSQPEYHGFYPCSMSSRTIVYKGRLNSNEVVPYFNDLTDVENHISIFLFHTRFSTNTEPATFMAQPFRRMAHNGELNTDKKNRLSEDAIAKQNDKKVIFPKGQSDSARLDQTLARRIMEDELDIVTAVLAMMPPAWENDPKLSPDVRAMYEYFSLYEEKNDGPAALIFSDGVKVGARLDRLGLRPLRSIETTEYVAVMSEAGQITFPAEDVIKRGRIEAGGMLVFDHEAGRSFISTEVEEMLAARENYSKLLNERSFHLDTLPAVANSEINTDHEFNFDSRHVAYSQHQESFRFLLDSMIEDGGEKITAMGYGVTLNVLNGAEGGMSRFFSQRFAQVTNPPLDSIREKDGMTLRVSLGAKPNFSTDDSQQIVIDSPILQRADLEKIRRQDAVSVKTIDMLFSPSLDAKENEAQLEAALNDFLDQVEKAATDRTGIIILSDENISKEKAAIPALLAISAANQRLVETGTRFNSSLIAETGQSASSHDVATILGFGASAICPLTVHNRAIELGADLQKGLDKYQKAIAKSLMKIMGKFGLCTAESYIGGEFFEANYINANDPRLKPHFPNINSPVAGVSFDFIAKSAAEWHFRALEIHGESEIPHLGLFKERQDGAGHSFGLVAVREYINMTNEDFTYTIDEIVDEVSNRFNLEERTPGITAELHFVRSEIGRSIVMESEVIKILQEKFKGSDNTIDLAAMRTLTYVFSKDLEHDVNLIKAEDVVDDIDDLLREIASVDCVDPLADIAYKKYGYRRRTAEEIDAHVITPAYRQFTKSIYTERKTRPAALRDIMYFPADINKATAEGKFKGILKKQDVKGNGNFKIKGLSVQEVSDKNFVLVLEQDSEERYQWLNNYFNERFGNRVTLKVEADKLHVATTDATILYYLRHIVTAHTTLKLSEVQSASDITPTFSSGAMSHGALVREAHEAVAQGANIAGSLSNSGEGGEKIHRFNTIKSSSIKQVASGRFGVWAGYLADPNVTQVEIKIAQGAKPGEGGQLPAKKVTVEIATNRGGTPQIELVSPPPHHDTYSIEDLGQLIHDCKAARAKVIVKLVSSEGIGTISVGVAKAGADVINVAGNTGGTGAAAVTSLKNTGRSAELGIAEVHQALSVNGLRDKVILRASNAHQTGLDVLKSAVLGADSFEFGTTALMMLKCVMAKNCNIKCPAGLTTNAELYQGDARALAQYFLNVAHEVRELLAYLGYSSLDEVRGKSQLLHLVNHPSLIGQLDFKALLWQAPHKTIDEPIYLEANFRVDDYILEQVKNKLFKAKQDKLVLEGPKFHLGNRDKTVGGQISIDIERALNYQLDEDKLAAMPAALQLADSGRYFLAPETITVKTTGSAGQSYGGHLNNGFVMHHTGTANDGVGKSQSGGTIVVKSPGGGSDKEGENVLIGNFALFGATGGRLFVDGEAGDRCAVRNSGASAVVEGAGDFCCEYMTSGLILNLGSFGKGFGNGMSGGNAYQYDPQNILERSYSAESVKLTRFSDDQESKAHEQIILMMLNEHVAETASAKAKFILENWATEKQNFWFITPRALYETQTPDRLVALLSRKQMIEELSSSFTADELLAIRDGYRDEKTLHAGKVPGYKEIDSNLIYRLTISSSIFAKASIIASEQATRAEGEGSDALLAKYIKNLIMTEDKQIVEFVQKAARDTYNNFEDAELASLLAAKRVKDYKEALSNRDIIENNTRGSMAWIIQQDRENKVALEYQQTVFELCAAKLADATVSAL